jgi:hypothetical protein
MSVESIMSFHLILFGVLVAAGIHIARLSARSTQRIGETILIWVLVGYCGIPMIGLMGFGLMHPGELAELTGFPAGSPFQTFTTWALLGMGIAAALGLRYRGAYLIGPALTWAVFFIGATAIHLKQFSAARALTHSSLLVILVTHGLISVILLGSLWASGVWRLEASDASTG